MIDLLGVIIGIWLAREVHRGNNLVIGFLLIVMCGGVLVGYPLLAASGIISAHGLAGNILFYITFLMSYLCVIPFIAGMVKTGYSSLMGYRGN